MSRIREALTKIEGGARREREREPAPPPAPPPAAPFAPREPVAKRILDQGLEGERRQAAGQRRRRHILLDAQPLLAVGIDDHPRRAVAVGGIDVLVPDVDRLEYVSIGVDDVVPARHAQSPFGPEASMRSVPCPTRCREDCAPWRRSQERVAAGRRSRPAARAVAMTSAMPR